MLAAFLFMRLGNDRLITRAKAPPPNPLAVLGRFFARPRPVAAWFFATIRSGGWWAHGVYLTIFAVQAGMGDQIGGTLQSITNVALFLSPVMLRWMQARPVCHAARTGFSMAATLFLLAVLPFLMAVKPSEQTEMSPICSSSRDLSGILTPGIAWAALLVAPISGIFTVAARAPFGAFPIAGRRHPRLGTSRIAPAE